MAAGGVGARVPGRLAERTAHRRGAEGPVVAVRRGHRGVRCRVGVAAARGLTLMAGALWERLARVFGRGERQRSEAERILLEADFGVEATEQILDRVSSGGGGPFQAALERAVLELLAPGSPDGDPGALARAPVPPTVLLIFGVNGVGKTTAVAKLGARLARGGRSGLFAAADTFRRGGAAQWPHRDQARRHCEGRERGGARAGRPRPDSIPRNWGGAGRPRSVRPEPVRAEAHQRVTLQLRTSVKYLKGVGPKRAEALARLGIRSVGDLLYHAPHRYLDATTITAMAKVQVGQEVTCVGRVVSTGVLPTRKGLRVFRAVLRDESGGGPLECAWPGQPFLERQIKKGQLLLVTGPVRYYHGRQLVPREFVILADEGETPERGLVLPVYPATEGLTHRQIRGLIHQHLDASLALVTDPHPNSLRAAVGLPELGTALAAVHRPATLAEAEAGRRRLAFDELFDQQLVQARARALAKRARAGISFVLKKALTTKLKQHLPFELTGDQRQAIREITDDMLAPLRMHRLLMGDVGTGKTVVALFAMLLAVENDYQAAIMAPTELLAEQHVATLTRLLEPLALKPDLLVGRLASADKAAARERIATGASRVVVGTHALIQEAVTFRRLGLAVIDEQHRFGVEQRAALVEKGDAPDVLLLTATPIPRSLALTLYGDLDVTQLRERPPGRGTVKTALRTEAARQKIYEFIRAECVAGRQAYVIYPVIEESERADLKAATVMAERLAKVFPELEVGLVHGRLKAEERDATMRAFRDNAVHVLVATSVIEVGFDVANATVMLIEHAERFGLAQLHQLRGRVGRGAAASHCILLSDIPEAAPRLQAFTETTDGFKIAELDLQERGMGELAGARQSGGVPLRYANFATDGPLLEAPRRAAGEIIAPDPALAGRHTAAYRGRIVPRD